jgi:hypothetical protein
LRSHDLVVVVSKVKMHMRKQKRSLSFSSHCSVVIVTASSRCCPPSLLSSHRYVVIVACRPLRCPPSLMVVTVIALLHHCHCRCLSFSLLPAVTSLPLLLFQLRLVISTDLRHRLGGYLNGNNRHHGSRDCSAAARTERIAAAKVVTCCCR